MVGLCDIRSRGFQRGVSIMSLEVSWRSWEFFVCSGVLCEIRRPHFEGRGVHYEVSGGLWVVRQVSVWAWDVSVWSRGVSKVSGDVSVRSAENLSVSEGRRGLCEGRGGLCEVTVLPKSKWVESLRVKLA